MKRAFQQHICAALSPPISSPNSPSSPPLPPEKPTLPALDNVIASAETELLAGNPEKDKPWFVLSEATLIPIYARRDTAQLLYYNKWSETNRLAYRESEKDVKKAVNNAKNLWAKQLAMDTMQYAHDPIK
eukprot:3112299-Ditylum_brightwellii.AAC.1